MVIDKLLKQNIIQKIWRYRQILENAGLPVESLIIFGSQAKGIAKEWSDIDLCVVSKRFGKDRHDERIFLMRYIDNQSLDIEPHPYHPNDLKDRWDPLAAEIRKYGITVT